MVANKLPRLALTIVLTVVLSLAHSACGQYLGVTCGYQYSAQLTGPVTYPDNHNISLYNPNGGSPYDPNCPTWTVWAEELRQAGVDFVCPNCTGSWPNTNNPPSQIAPFVAAINNLGLTSQLKFAIFDDNAASWCAQWNLANGRGFGYALPMDLSDTNTWKYLYDYNYKVFYQTVPDANRFKLNGRPVIFIWTSSPTFVTNQQGNLSQALTYVRQSCQRDFGFNPYIVANQDFIENDTTCNNTNIIDAAHDWFGPPTHACTMWVFNGVKVGVACASFGVSNDLPANHGQLFENDLHYTVSDGALLTLCEGFTDYEEDAAQWWTRNLDTNGAALTYDDTGYDYPNQRVGILREHSRNPFPATLQYEAEGCDYFGNAAGGNGETNFYRNGNIAIQPTTDAGGGFNVGWMQSGEWFEWESVPLNGTPAFVLRVATQNSGSTAHLVIDGVAQASQALPDTGGLQTYADVSFGPYGSYTNSYHTVRIVFDNGGANFNWWQSQGTPAWGNPGQVNLALNETVAVSSDDGVNLGPYAVDGDITTRWASQDSDPQWIYVDLGSVQTVDSVIIAWEAAYAVAFQVQVSADASAWTTVYSTTNGTGGIQSIPFSPTAARYVRMYGTQRTYVSGVQYGYSIYEFEVYGTNSPSQLPMIPAGLNPTVDNGQITLNWGPVPGAASFNVKRSTTSGGPYTTIANLADTSYSDTNVTSGTTYYYLVSAANGSGQSANSGEASATLTSSPPMIPTGLNAAAGNGQVALSWVVSTGASSYNVKRSTNSGGPYTTIASVAGASYSDTGVLNETTYYYVVSAVNPNGESGNSAPVGATPQTTAGFIFTGGTFTGNSVLSLAGSPAQELYGVSLGDGTARTTANGYKFGAYPSPDLSYGGSGAYGTGGFLGGGGTSGDAGFDAVLDSAELGINSGVLTLDNLTAGATYNVLFLAADTRNGIGARAFTIAAGGATSPAQSYAFTAGNPSLGGYILCAFVATGTTQTFTNTQAGYGYQLDGVMVATATVVSATPPPLSFALNNGLLQLSWPLDHLGWQLEDQTNPPGVGLGNNWYPVPGSSATNQMFIPIARPNGNAFFRLAYP